MKKLIVVITAMVFVASLVVPVFAATTSSTPTTGMHKVVKPGMTSGKMTKSTKTAPSSKRMMAAKKMKKTSIRHHKKMSKAAMRAKGPMGKSTYVRKGGKLYKCVRTKSGKRYYRKSTGKACPAMPGQTY